MIKSLGVVLIMLAVLAGCEPQAKKRVLSKRTKQQVQVLEFWAPWCGPCRQMKPILAEYEEQTGVAIRRIDVDESPELARQHAITSIPAIVVVRDGQELDRIVGVIGLEGLKERLASHGL